MWWRWSILGNSSFLFSAFNLFLTNTGTAAFPQDCQKKKVFEDSIFDKLRGLREAIETKPEQAPQFPLTVESLEDVRDLFEGISDDDLQPSSSMAELTSNSSDLQILE